MYEKRGRVAYLSATDNYVTLGFFNGAALSDPEGKIEGTGKMMRHLKVRALEDIDEAGLVSWIRQALVLDEAAHA